MSKEQDRDSQSGMGTFSGTKPTGPMTGDDIGTAVNTGGYSGSTSGDVEGSGGLADTTDSSRTVGSGDPRSGVSGTTATDPTATDDQR